ncbi:MAG TPA: hypothetical protein VNP72_04750 [Longimicrobium sp.]|nr:hypothetical protein [Longimicrobium sp.]
MTALPNSAFKAVRWPFANLYASPLWLGLRVYLGLVWLQFGLGKVRGGWLTGNPMKSMLTAIAEGNLPGALPGYDRFAGLLLEIGADRAMSIGLPLFELAVAAAFFSGALVVPAAIAATLMNVNLILSGIASWHFDGHIIAMQVLLLLAWRVAGYLGLARLRPLARRLRIAIQGGHTLHHV